MDPQYEVRPGPYQPSRYCFTNLTITAAPLACHSHTELFVIHHRVHKWQALHIHSFAHLSYVFADVCHGASQDMDARPRESLVAYKDPELAAVKTTTKNPAALKKTFDVSAT